MEVWAHGYRIKARKFHVLVTRSIVTYRNVFACTSYFTATLRSWRVTRILSGKRFFDVLASVFELTSYGIYIVMNEDNSIGGGGDFKLGGGGPKLDKSEILYSKIDHFIPINMAPWKDFKENNWHAHTLDTRGHYNGCRRKMHSDYLCIHATQQNSVEVSLLSFLMSQKRILILSRT